MISYKDIKIYLPHRYPMLLIDSVIELDKNKIKAIKNITGTEFCYDGLDINDDHAYPQAFIVESFGQASGLMYLKNNEDADFNNKVMFFGSVTGMKFYGNAYPGDTLEHQAEIYKIIKDTIIVSGSIFVNKNKIADVERVVLGIRSATVID